MNFLRKFRKIKFELIRKCHFLWYDYTFKKIASKNTPMSFRCNICGAKTEALLVDICSRESPSCAHCGSNLRMRSVIHLLSQELFGTSIPLPDFPQDRNVYGLGMSDRDEYAKPLSEKLSYTNTYYHKEPRFDISDIDIDLRSTFNFIISCDVFEHVMPPTLQSFSNLHLLLKDDGFTILTVPYMLFEKTWEHFPELNEYEIINPYDGGKLINTTKQGKRQEYSNLSFHGGPGATLEMRVFTKKSLRKELKKSGFKQITFCKCYEPKFGIIWPIKWSLPILAKKRVC